MSSVLIQMFLLMVFGAAWRVLRPAGLNGDQTRLVLTTLVYYLFLPGLILKLMNRADLGMETLSISLFGVGMLGFSATLAGLYVRWRRMPAARAGAVWLAMTFPNITFLGLPVLLETFGDWAALMVIQLDYFASTPLVLTLGVGVARAFGSRGQAGNHFVALLRVPPLWAAIVGVGLNLSDWSPPSWWTDFLNLLAGAVTPLMLLALGLALDWRSLHWKSAPVVLPVVLLKLILMPAFGWWLGQLLGFSGKQLAALVLEAGMPSMMFGIVLGDRFGLESRLYALLVTATTLLSMASLPLWYRLFEGAV
ncbi:MAG: AEC family transporter [Methylohalobius sp. ZOD2]